MVCSVVDPEISLSLGSRRTMKHSPERYLPKKGLARVSNDEKVTTVFTMIPKVIASCCKATKDPRTSGGAIL